MTNNNSSTQNLDYSLNIARNYLNVWAQSIENSNLLAKAFGNKFNRDVAKELIQNWREEKFAEFPNMEIVSGSDIDRAKGAYAKDNQTIYLARELLNEASNESIAAIILEEYGHHLDTLLNQVDTPGDEGAIFSALIRGKELAPEQLQTIKIEDDSTVVHLNGQPVRIEQASFPYSESGTNNKSLVTFDTGVTKGKIILDFETYYVPDRVQVTYEGGTLIDSNFVGTQGEKTISEEFDGDSTEITVQVTPNANGGTAWYYTVNAELEECSETGDLNLEADREFEHDDISGFCETTGEVKVGRSDPGASAELISVNGLNPRYNDSEFKVNDSLVYALINTEDVTAPLFRADLNFPLNAPIDSSIEEIESDNDFTLAGLEIDFRKIRLDKNEIVLEGGFSLPNAIGGLKLDLNAPNALIISSDAVRVDGGNLSFPDEEFKLFDAFNVTSESVSIEYSPIGGEDGENDELKIQGKFALVTPFFKGSPNDDSGAALALDISGDGNYLRVVGGQADVSGKFLLEEVSLTEKFKIKELSLSLTTNDGEITEAGGTAAVTLPFSVNPLVHDGTGIKINAGFVFPDSGIELDKILVEANDLDLVLGSTGIYLQKLNGGINNIAPSNNDSVEYGGEVGLTYGPEIDINLDNNFLVSGNFSGAAVSLELDANTTVKENNLTAGTVLTVINENFLKFVGTTDFSWEEDNESLIVTGAFDALAGMFAPSKDENGIDRISGAIEFDFAENTIEGSAKVDIAFPDLPFFNSISDLPLAGQLVASAQFDFSYSNDGIDSNDFIRAYGLLDLGAGDIDAGFQYNFDNNYKILDEKPDLLVSSNATTELATKSLSSSFLTAAASSSFVVAGASEVLAQNSGALGFEETYEVKSNVETIVLNARWTNTTNPDQISVRLLTPDGNIIEEADFDRYDNISIAEPFTNEHRKSVVVANPSSGNWGIEIVDKTGLENVETGIYRQIRNIDPTIEILDVSQNADGSEITITYKARDPDTNATFDLYYQADNEGYDFINSETIASDLPEEDGIGTYVWNTEGIKPGEYYILAQITGQHGIRNLDNDYSSAPITITREADLSVELSADVEREAIVGENVTYTATVTNNSSDVEAKDVNVYITIPRDFELVSTSIPAISTEGRKQKGLGDIELNVGQLSPQESQTVEVVLDPADSSEISGWTWATVTSETYDPNSDNYRDDVFISVVEPPVLEPFLVIDRRDRDESGQVIEPDPSRIEIQRDEPYTYEIAVTNTGEGTATGVVLTENIFDLAPQLGEVTLTQGDYSYDSETGEVTANFGEIAAGETETVSITLTPGKAKKASSTSTIQYNERYETDEVTTRTKINLPPVDPADLELTQTVDNSTPLLGEEVNITLRFLNKGPGVAAGTEIKDLLPEGLSFVRANPQIGTYDPTTGIWDVGNIRDGSSVYLTITALVEDVGNITNQAEVILAYQKDPDSTPDNGEPGEDDFSSLTITGIGLATDEDVSLTITAAELLSSDANTGDNLSIVEIVNSVNGTAIINADGDIYFTPDANFYGKASFDYTVTDGTDINTVTADVIVKSVNDILIANDDTASTDEDTPVTILAEDLFDNDDNGDVKDSRIDGINDSTNGTAIVNADGNIEFTPDANFNGITTFDYTITDGIDSETASVEVTVNSINDVPVANDDNFTIDEDAPLTILATELLSNDTDVETPESLSVTEVENTVNGTVRLNGEGNIEFFPDANFNGTASFNYTVTDGADSDTASVEVVVNAINDPLVANDDNFITDEDTSLTILASELFDNDVNNDIEKSLSVSEVSNSIGGTAVIDLNGDVEFTPDLNFNGTASFDYTVTDGDDTETASVEVEVNAINDVPVANKDTFTTDEDTPITVLATELLANDTDVETLGSLSVTEVENAVNGTVSLNGEGEIEFAPELNFYGTASFEYTLTDSTDDTIGLVEIEVDPVNDTPFITTPLPDLNLPKNSPNSIVDYADYFEDIEEKDNLYYRVSISNGSIVESFRFDPDTRALVLDYDPNFVGTATVTAEVADSEGASAEDSFDITIFETVNKDIVTTDEEVPAIINPADLLGNDIGDNLSFVGVENAVNGTVILNESGKIEFTPDPNFDGTATFNYTVFDGTVNRTGLVEVVVNPINDAPVVTTPIPDLTLGRNPANSIINYADYFEDVEDGDNLAYSVRTSTSISGGTSGQFFESLSFDPDTRALVLDYADDVIGTANITAIVTDDDGISVEDTFTVSITDSQELAAVDDRITVNENSSVTVLATELLSNDVGDNLSLIEVSNPVNGTVDLNEDDNVEFIPDLDFSGTASFDYTVTDGIENATASVEVTVNTLVEGFTANDDSVTIDEDISTTILASELLANDSGNNLSLIEVSNSANGAVSLHESGNVEFVPNANFYGTANFDYTVSDGTENSTASVEVIVNSINDVPILTSPILDFIVTKDAPDSTIEIPNYFDDVEDENNLAYSVKSSSSFSGGNGQFYDNFSLNSTTKALLLDYAEGVTGTSTITVTATDSEDESIETSFTVKAIDTTENDDSLVGSNGNDYLAGLEGKDSIKGQNGDDTLAGGSGNDTLRGNSGNDLLTGGDDNDILYGNGGDDTIDGGAGSDRLYVITNQDITLTDTQVTGDGTDTFSNIEQTNLYGREGNNTIDARNTNIKAVIKGNAGDDTIYGGVIGDVLSGDAGNDVIYGLGGNDTIKGGAGEDILHVIADNKITLTNTQVIGDGRDRLSNIEQAHLYGGEGNNLIDAKKSTNIKAVIEGYAGKDTLRGGALGDSIFGGDGNDILYGNGGDDTIDGGAGSDRLYVITNQDITLTDTQVTGDGTDTFSNIEQTNLYGREGNNTIDARNTNIKAVIKGNEGDDVLMGGQMNDDIQGGSGNDTLYGTVGNDVLIGNDGADMFALESVAGRAVIRDFQNGEDLFGLTGSLGFEDLRITNNSKGTASFIRDTSNSNQLLAIVNNIDAADLTVEDFASI